MKVKERKQQRKETLGDINKLKQRTGKPTTDTKEIQNILRKYLGKLYSVKLESLKEMDKFLGSAIPPMLTQKR